MELIKQKIQSTQQPNRGFYRLPYCLTQLIIRTVAAAA